MSTTTARRNARGEVSEQRILDATLRLLGRYGYDNTTIARITREARLPASSIYWYFANKDDLVAAALESFYNRFRRGRRSWNGFDQSRSLLSQLSEELKPELRASESEEPLRLGIMLALERDAADAKIQEPFHRRRDAALHRIEAWWGEAFSAFGTPTERQTFGTWWMATLTLAYLDGHYISDLVADDTAAAHRSRIVGYCLAGAFEMLSRVDGRLVPPISDGVARRPPSDELKSPKSLLRVTRSLVAEHGYEGATIGRICSAAGIKRSSAYWRYESKDALVKAAVSEPYLALLEPLRTLRSTASWPEELARGLAEMLRLAHQDPDTVRAGLLLRVRRWDEPASSGSAVQDGTATTEKTLATWLASALSDRTDAEGIAEQIGWTVVRLAEGLMLVSALGRPVPSEALVGVAAAMFAGVVDHLPVPA